MSSRFISPFYDVGSGIKPPSGAKLFFFATDGVTPKDTYSDQLATPTANANPVIADSNGVFGDIYISGSYKVTLKDTNGSQIYGLAAVEEFTTGDFDTNLINDLSQPYIFDTVALFKSSLIEFPDGKTISLKDRKADFIKVTGSGGNDKDSITSTPVNQTINLVKNEFQTFETYGAIGDDVVDDDDVVKYVLELGIKIYGTVGAIYRCAGDTKIIPASGTVVVGNGAIIKYDNATETRRIILRNDGTVWFDIEIHGKNGVLHNGLPVQNSSNHWMQKVKCFNHGFYGFSISENTDIDISLATACSNIVRIDCTAEDCGFFGYEDFPKLKSENNINVNCVAENCGHDSSVGAGFKPGQATVSAQSINCTARNCNNSLALANWESNCIKGFKSINATRFAVGMSSEDWSGGTYNAGYGNLDLQITVSETPDFVAGDANVPAMQITQAAAPTNTPTSVTIDFALTSFTGNPFDFKNAVDIDYPIHFSNIDCYGFSGAQPSFRDVSGGVFTDVTIDRLHLDWGNQTNISRALLLESPNIDIDSATLVGAGQYAILTKYDGSHINTLNLLECNTLPTAGRAAILFAETLGNRMNISNINVINKASGGITSLFAVSGVGPTFGYGNLTSDTAVGLRVNTNPIVVDLVANVTIN